jgi:hypothetical protein
MAINRLRAISAAVNYHSSLALVSHFPFFGVCEVNNYE